jgi:hypothetical protein
MQMRNGSLQHYIPGIMNWVICLLPTVKKSMEKISGRKLTNDAASYKPLFYPMQGAIKKYAGISYE